MRERMIRKQVYIEPAQERFLKHRADQLGVTEAELIRRAIGSLWSPTVRPTPDPDAWEAALAFLDDRESATSAGEGRAWTRAELYEDRPGHVPG